MMLRIATRGSALARAQALDVARRLDAQGHHTELVVLATAGDRATDRAFTDVGAFGVFVREIEESLLDGRADLAVHSYKDLPSRSPDGLVIAAVPERLDAADMLLVRPESVGGGILPVRQGARVGTSAARRKALVAAARPDLRTDLLRGNVPTRVAALISGTFDAIVLASAGIARLDRASDRPLVPESIVCTRLDPRTFVPAPAQGAIAVQVRADATQVFAAVRALDDPRTARALRAERRLLALAEAGCALPFGAWCEERDGALTMYAVLGQDGGTLTRAVVLGTDPDAIADAAWSELSIVVAA